MRRAKSAWAVFLLLAGAWALVSWAQSGPTAGDFVLFGSELLKAKGLTVESGDIGSNVLVWSTKRLDAAESRVAAGTVKLHQASTCDELFANNAQTGPGCGPRMSIQVPLIPNLATTCGAPTPFPQCSTGRPVQVEHDGFRTLAPGVYGDVHIAGGGAGPGTLVLSGGTYTFCSLRVSRNAQLLVRGATQVNVVGQIKFDNGSSVRPETPAVTPCELRIFSNGPRVHISRKAEAKAVVCAPKARLDLTKGSHLTGAFLAREVRSDRVTLVLPDCPTTPTSSTTTSAPTTTTPSSTTTSTTQPGLCGNGVKDPSEPCDPSSPAGALLCPVGQTCSPQCQCVSSTTTTTTTTTTSSSNSTTTTVTTTTQPNLCGNGVKDPNEPCDPTSPAGALLCPPGESCTPQCTCESNTTTTTEAGTTSTTTTTESTTSSTGPITTTTTTTTTSTSTTTQPAGPAFLEFTTGLPTGTCGQTFRNTTGTGTPLKNLACGGLNLGGGAATVGEGPTPDGSANRFTLSCAGSSCTLGPTSTPGATYDCTDTGCRFGTPLPIVNGSLSVCVGNTFSAPSGGTLDLATGVSSATIVLNSHTIVTANATQPCPICRLGTIDGAPCAGTTASPCTGVCEGSPNQGDPCTSTNSQGLSRDCPAPASGAAGNFCYKGTNNGGTCTGDAQCPDGPAGPRSNGLCSIFVGDIPVNLSPLTSGTAEKSAANGLFCTEKRCAGGPRNGLTCTVAGDCTGTGSLGCLGQDATTKGAFLTNICHPTSTNSGMPCKVDADCPNTAPLQVPCRLGTSNNFCNGGANDGKGCTGAAECPSPGVCTKAGILAQLIREVGVPPGPLTPGVPAASTLATVFCVPGTGNLLINGASNLPGPGATSLPGTVLLLTTTTVSQSTTTSTSTTTTTGEASTTTSTSTTTTTLATTTTSSSTTTTSTTTTTVASTTTLATTTTTTTTTTSTTSTTSTTLATTTTTTTTTSSTTTTTSSTTTTTQPAGPSFLEFTTGLPTGTCGQTFRNTTGTGTPLKNLACGGLNLGGGAATVGEGPTPDGSANRFTLSCAGSSCTLGPTSTPGATYDCTDTGCRFGTPLPIVNGSLSVCVGNTFSAPSGGTLDLATGVSSATIVLNSHTIVTANATQPCPICRLGTIDGAPCAGTTASPCTGVCEGSPNQGDPCTSTNSQGLSRDCPAPASGAAGNFCYKGTNNGGTCTGDAQCPDGPAGPRSNGLCSIFVGDIPVNLSPLTSGTAEKSAANGLFCTEKRCAGGPRNGLTCTVAGDCTGTGSLGCLGQDATTKGAFLTNICHPTSTNSGMPCKVDADCPNTAPLQVPCRLGTSNNFCNGGANDGKGCTGAAECPSPGVCTKAGILAQLIREVGVPPGALTPGVPASGTLVTVFCVPGTGNLLINGASNLPGPGATSLPGTVLVVP